MQKHGRWAVVLGSAILSVFGFAGASQAADQTVKIGMVLGLSGPGADIGESISRGADLYVNTHQKDLPAGVKIELIKRDDGGSADRAKRLAQELAVQDHVQMLAGVTLSPQAYAIAPISTQLKLPTLLMNATTGNITRSSPYFVRFSHANWQMAYPMGVWAAKHNIKTAYTLVSDYAAGIDMETGFKRGFEDNGGKVIGSDHAPLNTSDFMPYMSRVKAAKPQALFVFGVAGAGTIAAMKGYQDAGMRQAGIQLLGTGDVVPDSELAETGPATLGMINASIYTATDPRASNKAFVAAWQKAYGPKTLPDFGAIAGWNGMEAVFGVVHKYGAQFTGDQAMDVLKTWKAPDSPSGAISIDPETRDIVQTVYVSKIEKVDGNYRNVPFETMPDQKDPWKALNPQK